VSAPRGGESHINSKGWGIFPGVEFTTPGGLNKALFCQQLGYSFLYSNEKVKELFT